MKRGQPLRRTSLKRGSSTLKRTRLRPRSDRAAAGLAERRRNMRDAFGWKPDCAGRGIIPHCPVWPHPADTAHEPGKRSQGADPTDPAQAIPLCDDSHAWVHGNPATAAGLSTRDGVPFLILGYADGARPSGTGRD